MHSTLVFTLITALVPYTATAADPIRICIRSSSSASGFVEPGTGESVADLTKAINGKKTMTAIDATGACDVTLEVLKRTEEFRGVVSTQTRRNAYTGKTTGATTTEVKSNVLYVKLSAGTYEKQIDGWSYNWGRAAKEVSKEVEEWVKANDVQLRRARKP